MRILALLLLATLSACTAPQKQVAPAVSYQFDFAGVRTVVLRAGNATDGSVVSTRYDIKSIVITGVPRGGAGGYHSPNPNWKETKPADWGMSFVAERFGDTLVISSKNETSYIHHRYKLESITLTVPPGVRVLLAPRTLSGDGSPDLSAP